MLRYTIKNDSRTGERYVEVPFGGPMLLEMSLFNKGTAWPKEERVRFGLDGLLPPHVSTVEEQVARTYANFKRKSSDLKQLWRGEKEHVALELLDGVDNSSLIDDYIVQSGLLCFNATRESRGPGADDDQIVDGIHDFNLEGALITKAEGAGSIVLD